MNSSIEKYVSPIHQETEKSIFFTDTYAEEGKIPALMGFGLALITWNREAGEAVRKSLQQFHNQFKNIQIIDLGQLLSNDTDALQSLCQDVKHSRILPVFIGLELQHITQLAGRFSWNVYHVANRITQAPETVDVSMSHISYQRHFSRLEEIYHIEEHSFNSLSLGKMRTFPTLLEPVLRDAQMLHIDLNCLRKSDAPNIGHALPTGLNAEELCQLAKYAGLGDRLECLSVMAGENMKAESPEAAIIAETLWYFSEGLNMNAHDLPEASSDISEFIISAENMEMDYEFIRHNLTQKWWFRIQNEDQRSYLACAADEYQSTVDNELPDRLARFMEAVA
ncbi:MAG: hypothetical protein LW630_06945 [Saprospiraceae bacterium]|jgi:hypothetical protein|nr:hypothetical protein [Saprospiraceae bacterium]